MMERLHENGMMSDDCTAIMDSVESDEIAEPMKGRWADGIDEYPAPLLAIAWLTVKAVAWKWLNENRPQHWAKPMFVPPAH